MKQLLTFDPLFDPTNKTVDFKFYQGTFELDRLYSIVNITRNTAIYVPGVSGYGITAFDGTMITLAYDTTAHASTDLLNVYYDAEPFTANQALERGGHLQDQTDLLTAILAELKTVNFILGNGLNIKERDIAEYRSSVGDGTI